MTDFPDPKEVELEFFYAMRSGYAHGVSPSTLEQLPGSKVLPYEVGFYRILDIYYSAKKGCSAGSTTIWYKDQPVWCMSYQGHYTAECIPFLKQALRLNYEEYHFIGGRGPEHYKGDNGWLYQNQVCPGSTFRRFRGREGITKYGSVVFGGYHEYQGMLLL